MNLVQVVCPVATTVHRAMTLKLELSKVRFDSKQGDRGLPSTASDRQVWDSNL